jgi:hypothetical protein
LCFKSIFIRYFIYILGILTFLPGCVDQLPVITEAEDRKLFVVCELQSGKDIVTDVLILGDIKGKPSVPVSKKDTFGLEYLSLVEGDVDFGVPFEFSSETKKFSISKERLPLKIGVPYKLRGINVDKFGNSPTVTLPSAVQIDSCFAVKHSKSHYKINLFISRFTFRNEFYHVNVKDVNEVTLKPTFETNSDAYKQLKHKSGFLVDGSRISGDGLEFIVESNSQQDYKNIKVEISKVTPSYYEYNYFCSNASENPELLSNPPIAALNIRTKTALGSFSALNTIEKWVTVR